MATNLIYQKPETTITFQDSSGDAAITLANLAAGAGRVSAQYDRGAGSKAMRLKWEAAMKAGATVVVGTVYRIYATAGTINTYADYLADAGIATETMFSNFWLIGQVTCSIVTSGTVFYGNGVIEMPGRYVNVGLWNATGAILTNTANVSWIKLTPFPDEIQAAA